ncbi:MAG: family 10 glycosylhydrolase [Verrucomicrobiota bacterium]
MIRWFISIFYALCATTFLTAQEQPPSIAREFRAAWIATVYNIDWPSKKGLSETEQKAEAKVILDKLVSLNMNAAILQVRPHADALYISKHEPWSPWLTGTMGKSPGYDPLAYWIQEGHARGIEIHAWFNPFRALANKDHPVSTDHISKTKPHVIRTYGTMLWADPSHPDTRTQAMTAILDVLRRYDVDGIHLDDYFYPYPSGKLRFEDGKTPAERRAVVDTFIQQLYQSVKKEKPWVRVGISPFGIWRPGVPEGIEAGVDSYEHLAGDSRKWLKNGWVDYLAPQLYWRIEPKKQSYTALLEWWRIQGTRPVWPGIATTRIQSKEDPTRTASEIINQIKLSRTIGTNWAGHIHWSAKGLTSNLGGINAELSKIYPQPAAIPPMPWMSQSKPAAPQATANLKQNQTVVHWKAGDFSKIAIQSKSGTVWKTTAIVPASPESITIQTADSIAITAFDRYGNSSASLILTPN